MAQQPIDPKPVLELHEVTCERCHRTLPHFVLEIAADITQLRVAGILVRHIRANCLYCGCLFQYDINDKHVEKMTLTYGELLRTISPGYLPE